MHSVKIENILRILEGSASHKKIGSRAIPHRLTQKERILFERTCQTGMLQIPLSGVRENLKNALFLYCKHTGKIYEEVGSTIFLK